MGAFGSTGNNTLEGNEGDDSLSVSNSTGNNTLKGGSQNDTLSAESSFGNNILDGGTENDTFRIDSSSGNNTIIGGTGDDGLAANNVTGSNIFSGGDGNDVFAVLRPAYTPDILIQTVNGGAGTDSFRLDFSDASSGVLLDSGLATSTGSVKAGTSQVIFQSVEQFMIGGTPFDDHMIGGIGSEDLRGGSGGNNTIFGNDGDDILRAIGTLLDSSENVAGNSILDGGNGNDVLSAIGSTGTTVLHGGNGSDSLETGAGVDILEYDSFTEASDVISGDGFNQAQDQIRISAAGFGGGLTAGNLSANQFTIGSVATTPDQRFIFDDFEAVLYFDQDGSNEAFAQVPLIFLFNGNALSSTDPFTVI